MTDAGAPHPGRGLAVQDHPATGLAPFDRAGTDEPRGWEDPGDWVLACIQRRFDGPPNPLLRPCPEPALASAPAQLALPPARRTELDVPDPDRVRVPARIVAKELAPAPATAPARVPALVTASVTAPLLAPSLAPRPLVTEPTVDPSPAEATEDAAAADAAGSVSSLHGAGTGRPMALTIAPRPLTRLDLARVIDVDGIHHGSDEAQVVAPSPPPAEADGEPVGASDLLAGLHALFDAEADADLGTRRRSRGPAHRRSGRSLPRRAFRVVKALANVAITLVILVLFLSQGAMGLLPFRASYVTTGSMSPGMPVGSLVISERVPASRIHKGDVITFPHPEKPGVQETHRVHLIMLTERGEVIITKGDANATPDAWRLPKTGTMWRRVASAKRLGYPFGYLQTPKAHLVVTLLPAFGLASWILAWIWKPVLAAKKKQAEA